MGLITTIEEIGRAMQSMYNGVACADCVKSRYERNRQFNLLLRDRADSAYQREGPELRSRGTVSFANDYENKWAYSSATSLGQEPSKRKSSSRSSVDLKMEVAKK